MADWAATMIPSFPWAMMYPAGSQWDLADPLLAKSDLQVYQLLGKVYVHQRKTQD